MHDMPNTVSGDLPPFELVAPEARADFIVVCDHASNVLPPEYGTLGLPAREFERHIAWDIGAAGVARRLAAALAAPPDLRAQIVLRPAFRACSSTPTAARTTRPSS